MNGVSYIASRLTGALILLFLAGYLHEIFIYPEIKRNEGWLGELAEQRIALNPDVIYFSASTNRALGPDDTDRRFISEMINDSISLRLKSIDTGAIHAGIFYEILARIPKDKLPKLVVVDMDIRSFGANWIHSGLENSLQRNLVYWNNNAGIINHFLASVKWYDYRSPVEHQRAIEYDEKFAPLPFSGSHRTVKKWCDSLFRSPQPSEEGDVMIRHFGFHIDEQNEQLTRFDKIAEWSRINRVPVIFVILPENVERMTQLTGPDLRELVKINAEFLEKRYANRAYKVLNLWDQAGADVFFESFPTEHYRSEGRSIVASQVAQTINQFHQK